MGDLRRYFDTTDDTPSKMAERIGCAISTITRAVRGERSPRKPMAERISAETGGVVSVASVMGIAHSAPSLPDDGATMPATDPGVTEQIPESCS